MHESYQNTRGEITKYVWWTVEYVIVWFTSE